MTIVAVPRPATSQPPRTVPARELLDESERAWSADVLAALRQTATPGEHHRRKLVLQALAAYERLRLGQASTSDELTVFRRWPACTVVALTSLAAAGITVLRQKLIEADPAITEAWWFRGWAVCWAELGGHDATDIPGASVLRAASIPTDQLSGPEFGLDPQRGALIITLPAPLAAGATVTAGGSQCVPQGARWLIARPTPVVTCEDALGEIHRVQVVDAADPLLLFSEPGALLPTNESLPPGEAWMLHLGEPASGWAEGPARVLERRPPPIGWSRWRLLRVLLGPGSAVRSAVDHGSGPRYGAWRHVAPGAGHGSAEVIFPDPLPGVFGPAGEEVYPSPPQLRLSGEPAAVWDVHVRPAGSPRTSSVTAHGGECIPLRDGRSGSMLGRYRVRAAGGGAPVVAEFTIAEGVSITPDRRVRVLSPHGGLRPARATVTAPRGVRAEPAEMRFGPYQREAQLVLRGPDDRIARLRVQIPHCAVRIRYSERSEDWEITPRTLTIEALIAGAQLDIRLPAELRAGIGAAPALAVETDTDPTVQEIHGHRVGSGDVQRYRLDRLVDTVRALGTVRLRVVLPGQEVVVATIRGNAPAGGIVRAGAALRFQDRGAGPLRVQVHARWAPWLAPQIIELPDGAAEVPLAAPFDTGTPLAVLVQPSGNVRVSGWPDVRDLPRGAVLFDVLATAGDGLPLTASGARAMSAYLAGRAPLPDGAEHLHLVWHVAARAPVVLGGGLGDLTAQECAAHLGAHPFAALRAVTRARVRTDEIVVPLIRSGLAAHDLRRVPDPDAVRLAWQMSPLSALIATSPLLPYLAGIDGWDPAELDDAERRLLDQISDRCSAPALAVLAGAPFLESLRAVDALASEERQLPGPPSLEIPAPELEPVRALGRATGFELLRKAAPSLACALVARLAAHGDRDAAEVERQIRHTWIRIARAVPQLAGNDIVLAEFVTTRRLGVGDPARSAP
ncbi:hypothetical protein [Pseudonocardia aurantiaca]|uniref:Uncharacterized protein n=1 Tax=Pseudonocardia aurantiaca TaxID=75290 RepID=A0ABW4FPP8_9PSEU